MIITRVIPTPFTIGYENLNNLVVLSVNDSTIGKLSDVTEALSSPVDGYHKIEIEQNPGVLYLDPTEIPQIHEIITQRYRIPLSSSPTP